ncbi:MAG: hypothetical protein GY940_15955, partial [bacterium]|nr:hypothetical protein [bacterium]
RWYEVRINGGNSSIYQQGTYDPDSNHRWMGSVAGDKNGNIAMGYSVSSSSMKPAIRYAGRLSTDPLGQLSQGEATMTAGTGHQTTYTRWGDYSAITIDPDDDETFWYTQEYYITSGTNWQTRIGSFNVGGGTPDPLAAALDYPSLTMTTSGAGNWYVFTGYSYFGGSSIRSPAIGDSQTASVETTISGFTSVSFRWAVSSQQGHDGVAFYIDGVRKAVRHGNLTAWQLKTFTVTSGTHTLKWTYIKDASGSFGYDTAVVDKLELN